MLGRKTFTQDELDGCRAAVDAQLEAYRRLADALGGNGAATALADFEDPFFTNLVLALDRWFVHRVRAVSGKDGNPLNEVELIADAVMLHGGVMPASSVIRYIPADSVLGIEVGQKVSLSAEDFERLSTAFLAEIERKFV
ncbi:MAG TPA: hypothetical protein VLB81_16535 [Gaiellales bacterium]|nr:hypothetical protein [Gaiellales bacterium]